MSNHGTIDPATLTPPDHAGAYAEAFQRGRDLAVQQPATGGAHGLGPRAFGLGVHVARMDEGGRLAVAKRAEALTEVLRGLQGATSDPAERLRMARHLAQVTPAVGLRPEDISLPDVTDTGVAGHIASVTSLRQALATAGQPRYVGPLHEPNATTQGGVRYLGPAR